MGEYIQQYFRIGLSIDMPKIFPEQMISQLHRIGQITVMCKADSKWRVYVERLRLCRAFGAGSWITYMTDTHVTLETQHVLSTKYVAHQTIGLAQEKTSFVTGHDPGSILSAVLQHGKAVVNRLVYRAPSGDSNNATHDLLPV